ncbi:MAG: hypothetical protein AAF488_10300, partial [Planctomycetota bacterium]
AAADTETKDSTHSLTLDNGLAVAKIGSAYVEWYLASNADLEGLTFSLDFEEELVSLDAVVQLELASGGFGRPFGTDWDYWEYTIDNDNVEPGSGGLDEGFVVGHAIFSETPEDGRVFPEGGRSFLRFQFTPRPGTALPSCSTVEFVDGGVAGEGDDATVFVNSVSAFGGAVITPTNAERFDLDRTTIYADAGPLPDTLKATVWLGEVEGSPGETVDVPLFIAASRPVYNFNTLIEYDASQGSVTAVSAGRLPSVIDDTFAEHLFPPVTLESGSVLIQSDNDPESGCAYIPVDYDEPVLFLHFEIAENSDASTVELELSDTLPIVNDFMVRLYCETRPPREPGVRRYRTETLRAGDDGYVPIGGRVRVTLPEFDRFARADCNGDGDLDGISDAVFLLAFNFLGGDHPPCLAACDVDSDGRVGGSVSDALYLLLHHFLGGPPPDSPFPECGAPGVSDEALGCARTPPCP